MSSPAVPVRYIVDKSCLVKVGDLFLRVTYAVYNSLT